MVGFLEQNIGTDSCLMKFSVIFYGGSSNIYIYTTNRTVFMLDTVNGFNASPKCIR